MGYLAHGFEKILERLSINHCVCNIVITEINCTCTYEIKCTRAKLPPEFVSMARKFTKMSKTYISFTFDN